MGKTAILLMVQKHFKVLGAMSCDRQPSCMHGLHSIINTIHIAFIIVCVICYIASVFCFLLSKAITFADYAEAVLFCAIAMSRFEFYVLLILKRHELSALITDFEALIEESKFDFTNSKHSSSFLMILINKF